MKKKIIFSIITPVLNGEKFIKKNYFFNYNACIKRRKIYKKKY